MHDGYITVKAQGAAWYAEFRDTAGNPDAQVVDLFGDHVLPTPFTTATPIGDVLAVIRKRNPDAVVAGGQ